MCHPIVLTIDKYYSQDCGQDSSFSVFMESGGYAEQQCRGVTGVTSYQWVSPAQVSDHEPTLPGPVSSSRGQRRIKTEQCLMDPEEEEKRRVRRERNKLAAARCRKRRVDQIESLQKDVDGWEEKKRLLQQEIASLEQQRAEFQFILDAHKATCKAQLPGSLGEGPRVVVKTEPEMLDSVSCYSHDTILDSFPLTNQRTEFPPSANQKPRPATLSLKTLPLRSIEGVSIDTPSTCLNFDSLLESGHRTGLTPTNILAPININVTSSTGANNPSLGPSCATQQRGLSITATIAELSSPTTNTPNLVSL